MQNFHPPLVAQLIEEDMPQADMRKFELGRIVMSAGFCKFFDGAISSSIGADEFLDRHVVGDHGDLDEDIVQANEDALVNGGFIASIYMFNGEELGVMTQVDLTETDCNVTTLFVASDLEPKLN
jgi:hypothetical protein